MAERLRFHLDESVDPAVARGLELHGVDVTTTVDRGLRSISDEAQLSFARSEGRVLVTFDADFLRLAASGAAHEGIAYCHPTAAGIGPIIRSLLLMYEVLSPDETSGRVEFLPL